MALTPMMQQYLQVKEKCKDCILFFRLGDFYEMFFEDAQVASKELELVLTGRDCGLEDRAPMCGIPYHAANTYIGRLINRGYKIAICEQMEDPALAKGIVKRDIIKIITPGTYSDPSFLEDNKNNYLMSVFLDSRRNMVGICTADISTGDFSVTNIFKDYSIILDEISKFSPKEIIIQEDLDDKLIEHIKDRFFISLTIRNNDYFIKDSDKNINEQFSINQGDFDDTIICASNGLLNYIFETQKIVLSNINRLEFYNIIDYLTIDANSRRNLELTETLRDKTKKGSLLWVIDKTNTAMGARQLRRWIDQPLMKKSMIQERLDSIEELVQDLNLHEDIKEILKEIYDIERIVGKVCSKSVNAKELISLKNSIEKLPRIKSLLKDSRSNLLRNIYNEIDELNDIHEVIDRAVQDNPSLSVKEGNIIKNGYNIEVDELRNAKSHGKEWIAALENNEKEVTGIKSLKVGYNKVFGYYIEITNANLNLVPEGRYIRKQTLSNAERYITPELKDMEEKILGAEDRLTILEYELFVEIRDKIERQIDRMQKSAHLVAFLDCLSSLATVALENNYCKPEITDDGKIEIEEGRHPVVEKVISNGSFIANNTNIDNNEEQLLLITGPNMAGKSTYMRQVALIVILAQLGSFVPATKATICICDKIFTRIGASDDLSAGKSTFMVEMWEVSNILRNITCRSLILLDEVGRGTSTYDGLSIAWSVIEYICSNPSVKCKTLFATHYHELTKLEGQVNGVKNYSVAVKEIGADIVFLRKIVKGGADQSYGIQVAKLAGLPDEVINRAKEILKGLEKNKYDESKVNKKSSAIKEAAVTKNDAVQIGFGDIEKDNLIRNIANIDFMNITPMDGFNKLYEIIKKAKELC